VSDRTDAWRRDIESGSTDRLLDAAWEAIEAVEDLEAELARARQGHVSPPPLSNGGE
jgi:hypothetical protein